jgi:tripartite-type tricarboxylate transporter receptor subunit TctC
VTSLQRLPFLPEVPTLDEQGVKGFNSTNWFGVYAPHGTPADIVLRVNVAFNQALQDADLLRRLQNLGATPLTGTPEDMARVVAAETAKWRKLIQDRKIAVD